MDENLKKLGTGAAGANVGYRDLMLLLRSRAS
jgi:hypothetical protein